MSENKRPKLAIISLSEMEVGDYLELRMGDFNMRFKCSLAEHTAVETKVLVSTFFIYGDKAGKSPEQPT